MSYYGLPVGLRAAINDAFKEEPLRRDTPTNVVLPPKPAVLIVVGPGGVLEVYSTRWLTVHIAKKLRDVPKTKEAQRLSREYLLRQLPGWARELYELQGMSMGGDMIRLRTPEEEFDVQRNVWLLREFQKLNFGKAKDAQRMETSNATVVSPDVPEDFDF